MSALIISMTLFIRFASLQGNISCILNPMCISVYIYTYHKKCFCLQILFYIPLTFSNDINKFYDMSLSTLVAWRN